MSAVTTSATGLSRLTLRLTAARFSAREGESLLYLAGMFAYTVAAALALTVAGGTWTFWNRWKHPHGILSEVLTEDPTFDLMMMFYFALAILACALLVPALVNLAAGAAVLGARGRERRLSALRLLGLSSGDVTRMSLLDALVQSVIGTAIGAAIYVATLPLWHHVTMTAMPLEFGEMLLPPTLFLAVAALVVLIGLFAAWRGLRQVRISPLGVARRDNKPRLSWLRAVVFLVVLVAAVVAVGALRPGTDIGIYLGLGGVMIAMITALNVAGPWVLQVIARCIAHLPGPTVRWAARRIAADPAATWRRASGLSFLAFIGGYVALMPLYLSGQQDVGAATRTYIDSARFDVTTGVLITLGVGFALTAASMLVTQASATIERAEQARAMHRMGAPDGFALKVMWIEAFVPLLLAVLVGSALGALLALPMVGMAAQEGLSADNSLGVILTVLVAGLALAAASLAASHPLHHRLLGQQRRRND